MSTQIKDGARQGNQVSQLGASIGGSTARFCVVVGLRCRAKDSGLRDPAMARSYLDFRAIELGYPLSSLKSRVGESFGYGWVMALFPRRFSVRHSGVTRPMEQ